MGMGIRCSRKRVARLMRKAGLVGVCRRRRRGITHRNPNQEPAPDSVERRFTPEAPNRLWVADMTEHTTDEGKLYLAVVIDAFSRWSWVGRWVIDRPVAGLAVDAVNMAVWNRRPDPGLVHHSDHGAQYTAIAFGRTLKEAGILGSMGTVGDALDNAVAESFFATLETELLDRCSWPNRQALASAIFEYVEGFESRRRRHSTLGYLSPLDYERRWALTERTHKESKQSVA